MAKSAATISLLKTRAYPNPNRAQGNKGSTPCGQATTASKLLKHAKKRKRGAKMWRG